MRTGPWGVSVQAMARRVPVPVLDLTLAALAVTLLLAELLVWAEWAGESRALQVVGATVVCSSLALRRAAPLVAVAIAACGTFLLVAGGDPPQLLAVGITGVLLSYTIAAELDGRALIVAAAVIALAVVTRDVVDPTLNGFDVVIDLLFFAAPFAVGRVVRRRERKVEHVARVADERTRDAIREERDRIARELHDVIAHGMSVMVIQADAARHELEPDEVVADAALAEIERTGRESLREMRRLLDLLRADDAQESGADLMPQPGLAGVDALARSVGQAGLPVDLRIEGEPRPVSPGIDLTAYRIVQEALTNALRHAGPARATVVIGYTDRGLSLQVEDDGIGSGALNGADSGGNGLFGMRERVRLYGGTLSAGPGHRGFVVAATLPFETPR
jgi:signal transduction histidine kinase